MSHKQHVSVERFDKKLLVCIIRTMNMNIGIFDSGIGGEAVAISLKESFSEATITVVSDKTNLPYGDKSPEEIKVFTDTAIQPLIGSDIIVIACNTATAWALPYLKAKYVDQKFIGLEPMIKPASKITKSQTICVFATPATLASQRYAGLKQTYASELTVLEPDCSKWAKMIEENSINKQNIADTVEASIDQGADVIVLGCTHYHWIKDLVIEIAQGRASVLEPSEAISRRVLQLTKLPA